MKQKLPSVCPLDCPDTCSLSVSVENQRIREVRGSTANPYTRGGICAKVTRYPELTHGADRLKTPLKRVAEKGAGAFAPLSWDEALDHIYNHNPVIVHPDQNTLIRGLAREDLFTVGCDMVMTDSVKYADIVLPACSHFEQADIFPAHGQHYLQRADPVIPRVGEALPNTEIFRRLARRFGFTETAFQATDETLMDEALDVDDPRLQGYKPSRPALDRALPMTFDGDEAARCLEDGMTVRAWNDLGQEALTLRITEQVRPGVACSYKGAWRRTSTNGQTVSALAPTHYADLCEKGPASMTRGWRWARCRMPAEHSQPAWSVCV